MECLSRYIDTSKFINQYLRGKRFRTGVEETFNRMVEVMDILFYPSTRPMVIRRYVDARVEGEDKGYIIGYISNISSDCHISSIYVPTYFPVIEVSTYLPDHRDNIVILPRGTNLIKVSGKASRVSLI
jgi:hypothetical protein